MPISTSSSCNYNWVHWNDKNDLKYNCLPDFSESIVYQSIYLPYYKIILQLLHASSLVHFEEKVSPFLELCIETTIYIYISKQHPIYTQKVTITFKIGDWLSHLIASKYFFLYHHYSLSKITVSATIPVCIWV